MNLQKQKSDYRKIKLEHYLSLFAIVAQSFDKAILGLSTASLGFTFVFLKYISKEHTHYMWMLRLSWLGFILAVIFVVMALMLAEQYALHRVKYHSYKMLQSKIKIKLVHCRDRLMSIFQYISAACFICAVVFFTIFVWINI
jgi:hypothetical protein